MTAALLLCTALVWWMAESAPPPLQCNDAADSLALKYLYPILGGREDRSRIPELKKWASALQDPCERQGYLHWIDYYERQYAKDDEEAVERRRRDSYEKERGFTKPPHP